MYAASGLGELSVAVHAWDFLKEKRQKKEGIQYAIGDQWRNNSIKKEEMEPNKNSTQL